MKKNRRNDLKTTTGLEETICLALARAISMSSLFCVELKSEPIFLRCFCFIYFCKIKQVLEVGICLVSENNATDVNSQLEINARTQVLFGGIISIFLIFLFSLSFPFPFFFFEAYLFLFLFLSGHILSNESSKNNLLNKR